MSINNLKQNRSNIVRFDCSPCGLVNIYHYGDKGKRKVLIEQPNTKNNKPKRCLICEGFNCQRISQSELARKIKCCHCEMIIKNPVPKIKRTDELYKKHLLKMKNQIKPLIDNTPPKLDVDKILKSKKLRHDFARLKEIYRDNMKLLRKINIIQHTTGRTDNFNPFCGMRKTKLNPDILKHHLKKIEKDNLYLWNCICKVPPTISKSNHDKHWKTASAEISKKSKYPICLPGFESKTTEMLGKSKSLTTFLALSRPRVFIEFTGEERSLGRIICALFYDSVPELCEMFYSRCGREGPCNDERQSFKYTGTVVSRIFPGLYCEIGDDSTSTFKDELVEFNKNESIKKYRDGPKYLLDCRFRGTLAVVKNSMCTTTTFYVTFKPLPVMNEKYEIFGRVISGANTLTILEHLGSDSGKTQENIFISKVGIIPPKPHGPICITECKS